MTPWNLTLSWREARSAHINNTRINHPRQNRFQRLESGRQSNMRSKKSKSAAPLVNPDARKARGAAASGAMKTAKSAKRGGTSQAVVADSQSQSSPFDITGRQRAEVAMRESEGLSQAVLGSISTQIAVLDKKGKIIAVNDAWTRFTLENGGKKYLRRTGEGVSYFNVCRRAEGADAAGALEAWRGIQAVLDGSQSHFTLEYPCHSPTRHRWFTLSVNPLLGSSGGVVVTHYDITARKQAEEAASRYRAQLESVFHAIQDGIVVADMEGAFLLVNEAQARMNGFPSVEAMKQNLALYQELSELSYPNGNPLPFEEWPINKVLRGESIRNWELRARRRDTGQEWFLSFSGEPVRDAQGKQILAVVGTNDITESKQAEEAVRESEENTVRCLNQLTMAFAPSKFCLMKTRGRLITDFWWSIRHSSDRLELKTRRADGCVKLPRCTKNTGSRFTVI
jgi:PAS domain S-box-containing protein